MMAKLSRSLTLLGQVVNTGVLTEVRERLMRGKAPRLGMWSKTACLALLLWSVGCSQFATEPAAKRILGMDGKVVVTQAAMYLDGGSISLTLTDSKGKSLAVFSDRSSSPWWKVSTHYHGLLEQSGTERLPLTVEECSAVRILTKVWLQNEFSNKELEWIRNTPYPYDNRLSLAWCASRLLG